MKRIPIRNTENKSLKNAPRVFDAIIDEETDQIFIEAKSGKGTYEVLPLTEVLRQIAEGTGKKIPFR